MFATNFKTCDSDHPVYLAKPLPSNFASILTDTLILVSILLPAVTGAIFGDTKLYLFGSPAPLDYIIYIGISCLIIREWFVKSNRRKNPIALTMAIPAFLWMFSVGIILDHELKWIVLDCFAFGGIIVGSMWASNKKCTDILTFAQKLFLMLFVMSICGILLYTLGIISSAKGDASRDLDTFSLIWYGTELTKFMPLVFVCSNLLQSMLSRIIVKAVLILTPFIAVTSALLLVSRGTILQLFLSLACVSAIYAHAKRSLIVLLIGGTICLLLWAILFAGLIDLSEFQHLSLIQKVINKTSMEESRPTEVLYILELLKYHELSGLGFGHRYLHVYWYLSGYRQLEGGLVHAPHPGAFAFLQKGGYIIYLFFIVVPFLIALWRFLNPRDEISMAFWSQVLLFLTVSTIGTGGWTFISTFFYGAFFTKAFELDYGRVNR